MQSILDKLNEWLMEMMIGGILNNLSGMFDNVNNQVGEIAGQVGLTTADWNAGVYSLIRTYPRQSSYRLQASFLRS